MQSFPTRKFQQIGILIALFLTAACSPTYINFDGPSNTIMTVSDKPYHLPSRIELWRPAGAGQSNRYNVSMVFTTSVGEIRTQGFIDVYGYNESDVDKVAINTCKFDDAQLTSLANGTTLIYKAQTASRQPLFDLTLSKK